MEKELKYLDDRIKTLEFRIAHPNEYNLTPTIKVKINDGACYKKELKTLIAIKQALTELKAIKEAQPSEAMDCSLKLYKMVESAGNGKGFNLNTAWKYYNTIKQALLKQLSGNQYTNIFIDEAVNPNEVMKAVEDIYRNGVFLDLNGQPGKYSWETNKSFNEQITLVKQYILKAQENEKENTYIEKVKTMLKQKDCVLRYVESEDCFAVKTMLSGWYKLTPEFVENNVREEIKPLPLIEKNKQLKEENAEYKEVLKVIKEKPQASLYLIQLGQIKTYEEYLEYTDTWDLEEYGDMVYTEEEFNTLKRWSEK